MTRAPAVRTSLLVLSYFAFISLGLPDGLIGVGWPSMRADFHVPTAAVGGLLVAATAGYLTSSVVAGFTVARVGVGWLLAGATALASVALAGYALSPGLAFTVVCAVLAGLGGGAIDSGLNAYAASAFGARRMNWLHAFFGLGVAFGPLIMTTAINTASWRWGYGVVSAGQFVLASAFLLTARSWAPRRVAATPDMPDTPGVATSGVRGRDTLAMPVVWLGALAFAVYVAIEVGAGLWAFLLLTEGRGIGRTVAGLCVSGYWASLFLGRVVQGLTAERLGSTTVLFASLVGLVAGAALVAVPRPGWLTVFGLIVIGFAAAPVFPLLTLGTVDRVGVAHVDRAIGLQIGASGLGGALVPAGIGVLLTRLGVSALGPILLVLALALLGLYTTVRARPAAAA